MKKFNKEQRVVIESVVSYNFGKEVYHSDTFAVYQFDGYITLSQHSISAAVLCGLDIAIEPVAYHVFRVHFKP